MTLYAWLNNRYGRTPDAQGICYDVPNHVHLDYNTFVSRAHKHLRFIYSRNHALARGTKCTQEIMLLRLIHAQLQSILTLWQQILERVPVFDPQYGPGFLPDRTDVDICDGLDTLNALENAAEEMGIAGYTRILIPTFTPEPCECSTCAPPPGRLAALWTCARIAHKNLPPALFERMFGSLRDDAART